MRIYLVGYMGSGKSSLGRELAAVLGYPFIDTDEQIEKSALKSIPEIFNEEGENAFRSMEQAVLLKSSEQTDAVIATGGGLPCFNNLMDWMNQHGITIYLKADPGELSVRLKKERERRPLISHVSDDQLSSFISGHLKEREPFYCRAKFILNSTEWSASQLAEWLVKGQGEQEGVKLKN